MSDKVEVGAKAIKTRVNLTSPANMPSLYAHHLALQDDGGDVVLSFFETALPFIPTEEKEKQKTIEQLESDGITATCIAKIRIAKHRLPLFVKVIEDTNQRVAEEMRLIGEQYGVDRASNSKD